MNRPIKFRAWDKFKNEMVLNPRLNYQGTIDKYFGDCADQYWEWMQFTGLLDKNGKEVWEGDIVDYKFNDDTHGTGPIIWSAKNYAFAVENGNWHEGLNGIEFIIVIGNIYENPELLTND